MNVFMLCNQYGNRTIRTELLHEFDWYLPGDSPVAMVVLRLYADSYVVAHSNTGRPVCPVTVKQLVEMEFNYGLAGRNAIFAFMEKHGTEKIENAIRKLELM